MKILMIGGIAESLINFRGPLLSSLVQKGHEVYGCAGEDSHDVTTRLKAIGVTFYPINLQRAGINPNQDIKSFIRLLVVIRKIQPDVVISYTIKPVIYGSLAAWLCRVPNIFSIISGLGYAFSGENVQQRFVVTIVRYLYRLSLSLNKVVFFQNPDDLALFRESKIMTRMKSAIVVNGSGVDLDYYAAAPPVKNRLNFLLIARLLVSKGVLVYIEAARLIKERHPGANFHLLGPFDPNPDCVRKELIEDSHKKGIIKYLGVASDVRPFIRECDIYVLPSFYREGTPRTVLEAMAMGRPIITTDAPGCRETVIQGDNGYLIPVKDARALAEAMERFIVNPEMIEAMGKRSRMIAEEKYDVHKVNAIMMNAMGL